MAAFLNTLSDLALTVPEPLWLLVWGAALITLGMYRRSVSVRPAEEPVRASAASRPAASLASSLAPQSHS